MTSNPDTMLPGKIAIEALRLMEDGRYRYLPIVDDGKVVGTVSRFDFGGLELDRMDEENPLVGGSAFDGRSVDAPDDECQRATTTGQWARLITF